MLFAVTLATAQDRPTHEIHAAMLFNFIKYIQWPNEGDPGEFVVGVIGDDKVYNTLPSGTTENLREAKNMSSKSSLPLRRLEVARWFT